MIWIVDCFSFEVFQFGYPVPDVVAIWITFLRLGDCVEYSLEVSVSPAQRESREQANARVWYERENVRE